MNKGNNNNKKQDEEEEEQRKVKQLNREIMFILEKHTAPFGYASAA
jgi:hypothetical protein